VWASIFGWLLLKDPLPPRTIVLVLVGIASAVAIFIWGSEGGGESSTTGDVLAVVAGIFFAATLLNYRYVAKKMPADTSMLPSTCAGSTCSIFFGLVLAGGDVSLVQPETMWILALDGGVLVGGAILLYAIGPRFITAAEVTLTCLLEPAIGPVWVFIALGDAPALASIVSGVCLIVALAAHEIVPLCYARYARPTTKTATSTITTTITTPDEKVASVTEEYQKLIVVSAKSG
jgi:drug/metabolite transporter (DMT)-like permease